jgi:hypothetical protein
MKEEKDMVSIPQKNRPTWLWISIAIALAALAILVFNLHPSPDPVSAHASDTFGPACGAATIDGIIDPDEWASAASQTFQMVNPGGGDSFTATLYVMNSGYYLYMGITINDDEFSTHGDYLPYGDMLRIDFDNDHGGILFAVGDDVLYGYAGSHQFDDMFILGDPQPTYSIYDTDYGGEVNGLGAAKRVGSLNHFELRHPLCSGDELDFCLAPSGSSLGDVGFRLEYMDAQADGSTGSAQFYPAFSDTAIADIALGTCSAVDLFIYLPLLQK